MIDVPEQGGNINPLSFSDQMLDQGRSLSGSGHQCNEKLFCNEKFICNEHFVCNENIDVDQTREEQWFDCNEKFGCNENFVLNLPSNDQVVEKFVVHENLPRNEQSGFNDQCNENFVLNLTSNDQVVCNGNFYVD